MFPAPLAIIDHEATGMSAASGRITDVNALN
jgi:hypothetical protein